MPHAVFPSHVKSDWWRWPGTTSLIAREYTKYVLTWARQSLENRETMKAAQHSAALAVSPAAK
ncbi:hypothetical protein D3C83_228760 [compost metagenome]